MTVVLDTSAAFEIAFNRPNAALYKDLLAKAELVIAPELFQSEAANVLWKYIKAGYIDEENAILTMTLVYQLIDEYSDIPDLAVESLHEAARLNHSFYDMVFLVLARRNAAVLLTQDQRLKNLAAENGIKVL